MDFALNEEQQGFVATARAFAQDQHAPYAAEWDANSHVAKDLSLIHISSPRDATLSRMPSSA